MVDGEEALQRPCVELEHGVQGPEIKQCDWHRDLRWGPGVGRD